MLTLSPAAPFWSTAHVRQKERIMHRGPRQTYLRESLT